ncbi:hypothetical protein RI129_004287 [Pyrocoelia pectoralis]|uniref:Uncharacterized protein n=1 Tax=Pyrocoelia pectoralis TaxID=417401 RepID=A0AAN7VFQ6_9COLE
MLFVASVSYEMHLRVLTLLYFTALLAVGSAKDDLKCQVPVAAPQNIEKVVNQCQDEIKTALLSEAFHFLSDKESVGASRRKRETFTNDERRIAGCLLQCVYRKMKAVNHNGFPTSEGLVALYTEGVLDKEYLVASHKAVNTCLIDAQKKHLPTPQSLQRKSFNNLTCRFIFFAVKGKTCDIAFDVFDCVSDRIGEYCGQSL